MKVCIYGAGAIGGWIGSGLARAGCDVSVVARGATLAALQQHGLRLVELQLHAKVAGGHVGRVSVAICAQCPVAQLDGHVAFTAAGDPETVTRNTLVMPELFALHVGNRRMRKHELFSCEL